jgi:hypothetical protein
LAFGPSLAIATSNKQQQQQQTTTTATNNNKHRETRNKDVACSSSTQFQTQFPDDGGPEIRDGRKFLSTAI